jgi:hypothetical protein
MWAPQAKPTKGALDERLNTGESSAVYYPLPVTVQ